MSLAGKPLLAYTVEAAKHCNIFDQIYVSSEDPEVLSVAEAYGATSDSRPRHLSKDEVKIIEVIQEFLKRREISPDVHVGVLLATCPLRLPEDIRKAYSLFVDADGSAPVASVSPFERPVQVAQAINQRDRLQPIFPDEYLRTTRSQDHQTAYWYNGAIVFNIAKRLATQRTLIGEEPIPYVMPFERSIDIDHQFQLRMVESILKDMSN